MCRGRRMEANPRTRTLDSRLAAIKRFSTPRRTLYRAPTNHLYPSLGTGQHVCRRSWAPRNQIPGSLTLVFEGGPRRPPAAGKLTRVERKSKLSSFILFFTPLPKPHMKVGGKEEDERMKREGAFSRGWGLGQKAVQEKVTTI